MGAFTRTIPVATHAILAHIAMKIITRTISIAAQCTTSVGARHVLIGHVHTADGCGIATVTRDDGFGGARPVMWFVIEFPTLLVSLEDA